VETVRERPRPSFKALLKKVGMDLDDPTTQEALQFIKDNPDVLDDRNDKKPFCLTEYQKQKSATCCGGGKKEKTKPLCLTDCREQKSVNNPTVSVDKFLPREIERDRGELIIGRQGIDELTEEEFDKYVDLRRPDVRKLINMVKENGLKLGFKQEGAEGRHMSVAKKEDGEYELVETEQNKIDNRKNKERIENRKKQQLAIAEEPKEKPKEKFKFSIGHMECEISGFEEYERIEEEKEKKRKERIENEKKKLLAEETTEKQKKLSVPGRKDQLEFREEQIEVCPNPVSIT